jgi:hypothetical protein
VGSGTRSRSLELVSVGPHPMAPTRDRTRTLVDLLGVRTPARTAGPAGVREVVWTVGAAVGGHHTGHRHHTATDTRHRQVTDPRSEHRSARQVAAPTQKSQRGGPSRPLCARSTRGRGGSARTVVERQLDRADSGSARAQQASAGPSPGRACAPPSW